MRRDVPLHRSLLVRLLATCALIALCSVAATTWLAVHATTRAVRQQETQTLDTDATVYGALLGYAASHPDWSGVGPTVHALSTRTGQRITLATAENKVIATSAPGLPLPATHSAVVDPLNVDQALSPEPGSDTIDPQALGPFQLSAAEHAKLMEAAQKYVSCAEAVSAVAHIVQDADGRPEVQLAASAALAADQCGPVDSAVPLTAGEKSGLEGLDVLTNACLAPQQVGPVGVALDYSWTEAGSADPAKDVKVTAVPRKAAGNPAVAAADADLIQSCIDTARRTQLRPYVAPTALLYVTTAQGVASPTFTQSPAQTRRIAAVAALVLLLTVALTVALGVRLIRPLIALADAVRDSASRPVRTPVKRRDEIGYLTAAFNELSEHRELLEAQRAAMVSDIAHELRTPVTNIRGWLEAVADGVVPPDEALAGSLLEEAVHLQHLIGDLEDLAAADAGRLRVHPEPMRVRELVEQVADAHRGRAGVAGVVLECRVEGDPELSADPVRLRQAVGNLVSNAVRHTPAGGLVTVGARRAGREVVIEVEDTGDGIAPEELPRIFDRFWRAEKSRNRRTGGSGLGLTIARGLVEAHGGTIAAASVPGKRTVLTIRLPGGADPEGVTGQAMSV